MGVFSSNVWLPKVLPWTKWDSFPRWDAGHSIALASFHSVMTHRQKRKMNNSSLDRLLWFVFFCGWLVGRCFSLAVHCSVVLFRLIIWFRFDSYTVSGRSTCIGTGRSGSCQLRSAHPSARSGCFSCCACGGHLCTLCLSSCDRGLYQGTNLQLGWCGYGWVDHVKRHPSLSSKRDVLNLRGEHVWEIQMFVGSKGNLSLKDRGAMPRHIIFRDVGSIHTRKYIYIES